MLNYISIIAFMLFVFSSNLVSSEIDIKIDIKIDSADPVPTRSSENEVPFSSLVTDEMSFPQAFATARRELGAGGFFNWKNNSYNTFYAEELEQLDSNELSEYVYKVTRSADYGGEQRENE